ncbi:Uncharacterized protein Rs2_32480 [Raphanus sativus]|nr:Uncharacterized protein Rs2_32480 [Raphanus sativus]
MLRDRGREIFLFFLFSSFRNLLNLLIRVYISHSAGVTRSNEQVFSAAISKQRNLGDQLPKFEHEHPKGKTGVYFFWDFNTTPLKESCDDVPNLKHNLTSAPKEYKQEYTLMEKEIGKKSAPVTETSAPVTETCVISPGSIFKIDFFNRINSLKPFRHITTSDVTIHHFSKNATSLLRPTTGLKTPLRSELRRLTSSDTTC